MSGSTEDLFIGGALDERRRRIAEICSSSPMFNVVTRRVDRRHLEDASGHWLGDFATQDYLGIDFDPEVLEAAVEATRKYGSVVAWCRLVATVDLFTQAEAEIAKLVGTEAANIFASTTLLNHGVIPALAGKDSVIFLDKAGHATMYEGAKLARDSGSKLVSFPSEDHLALERLLEEHRATPKKLILTDGVYSMTGDYANLPRLAELARRHQALLFVDDAHGFGVVGERPDASHPYGRRGNGLVRYFDLHDPNILYVGCFSKAYGTYGSFIACSTAMRSFLLSQATPHDLGGHGPASAMAALLAGLRINAERGDAIRERLHALTVQALTGLRDLGLEVENSTDFPIISVWLGNSEHMIEASKILYRNHVLLTLAPYPMVRRGDEAFRLTVTPTNTEEQLQALFTGFREVRDYLTRQGLPLRRPAAERP
ncbi:MAG: aminotransferase class I/II-fold pyridoxal phosphate-dependent enzyme [Deltaproteobacteria bacterium]|nr:aminotransferase class I/II-fold pyridoxal phosphate-dependent enzyme [Deltaproteobacteria bacterium]